MDLRTLNEADRERQRERSAEGKERRSQLKQLLRTRQLWTFAWTLIAAGTTYIATRSGWQAFLWAVAVALLNEFGTVVAAFEHRFDDIVQRLQDLQEEQLHARADCLAAVADVKRIVDPPLDPELREALAEVLRKPSL